jgi:hypothetical protein
MRIRSRTALAVVIPILAVSCGSNSTTPGNGSGGNESGSTSGSTGSGSGSSGQSQQGPHDFPRGVLGEEREAVAVLALVRLGRRTEAAARGQAFLNRYLPDRRRALGHGGVRHGGTVHGVIGIVPGSEASPLGPG